MTTPTPLLPLPDIERLLADFLKNIPELAAATIDNRPPPNFDGLESVVLISRTGGAWIDDQRLDQPLVELETYGATKTAAHHLALSVRAALMQLRYGTFADAVVTDVVEESAARWLPNYNYPSGNRYLTIVRVLLRPVPAGS